MIPPSSVLAEMTIYNRSKMADTSLIPGSKKSETVLVTTISNQHLCTQTTTLGPTLTLQFGTDKLDQETFRMRSDWVIPSGAVCTQEVLISLEQEINHVPYYVTAQEKSDKIKLQQFSEPPDPAHPDGRMFILEMANTYCFLQSWARRGWYLKSNQSTVVLEKRLDQKQFLFDFLPLNGDGDYSTSGSQVKSTSNTYDDTKQCIQTGD